jgi:hypothetical protein
MALIGRIVVVGLAFLVASVIGWLVLLVAILPPVWADVFAFDMDDGLFHAMVGVGAAFVAAAALLPAIVVIAIAEAFRLRSFLFYGAAGGLLALAPAYGLDPSAFKADASDVTLAQAFAAAGIVAGFVYWLLAGRHAGRWREPLSTAGSSFSS